VVSDFGGVFPLLYIGGSLDGFGDGAVASFWVSDWDRWRSAISMVFFLRSWLFVDKCPGV
jgi:hypothetical protein